MNKIAVCDKDEEVIMVYKANAVPRIGELINFPHRGSFRILEVAYRISDDNRWAEDELLMYIEVIIDLKNPIKRIG